MNNNKVNASAAAVANIVSGAVIHVNALGLSSNSSAVSGTGAAREEVGGSARGQPDTARGDIRNRNSRLESEQHIQLG